MKVKHDSEIPKDGQQVITVCAFIYKIEDSDYKVFRPKRADTKKFLPGVYELPGGHVDFGENLIPALKREILEEFGCEIKVGELFYAFTYINEIKKSHSVELVYFAQFGENQSININPEDHSGYKWMSKEETINSPETDKNDDEYTAVIKGFEILEKSRG